jgi:hypothetical protein
MQARPQLKLWRQLPSLRDRACIISVTLRHPLPSNTVSQSPLPPPSRSGEPVPTTIDILLETGCDNKDITKQHNRLVQLTSATKGLSESSVRKFRETHNKLQKTFRLLSGLADQFHHDQQPSMHTDQPFRGYLVIWS